MSTYGEFPPKDHAFYLYQVVHFEVSYRLPLLLTSCYLNYLSIEVNLRIKIWCYETALSVYLINVGSGECYLSWVAHPEELMQRCLQFSRSRKCRNVIFVAF